MAHDGPDALLSLADVQRLLLPDDPAIAGLAWSVHYQPAAIAAGDYYDLMALGHTLGPDYRAEGDREAWGLMVADVSGHGAAAALEAAQFDAILRTYDDTEPPHGPAGALTYANRHFFSRRQRRHFLTVFAALYRPDIRRLQYVSAGHPPALLRHADGRIERLGDDGDIPIGIERTHRWSNVEVSMDRGATLLVCTDGILEAGGGAAPFGMERLAGILAGSDGDANAVRQAVVDALVRHQGGSVGRDDQTLVVLQQAN